MPTPRIHAAAVPVLLAAVLLQCSRKPPAPTYVKADVCANCHAEIYRTYRHTGMARAFYIPSKDSFPSPQPYFHPASDTWYQIVEKSGAYYQRSWQAGLHGPESVGESKIDYVMGSGNHVRSYLHRSSRNTLIELPLAWYSESGGTWALNPGFDTPHPPAGRKIGYDCMFCHNAYPAIPSGHNDAGAEPVYEGALPEGIDCQRCHGPGSDHARDPKIALYNPKSSMDVCQQCHLETTSFPLPNAIRRYDRAPFSYQPSEPLANFSLFFDHAPNAGLGGKFEIVSSVYRLRQSRCFLQSKGALTCTTCHNPHDIPHGPAAADRYNAVCRQCHATVAAANHTQLTACIDCHMPKRRTDDVVHGVMTDHLIERRKPADNPPLNLANYHGEVVPYGPADPLYTAIAQVAAKANLESGIPRLESAIARLQPTRPEPYLELANACRNSGQFAKAIPHFQAALARRPNSALILRRLADNLTSSGDRSGALDALTKATQSEPANPEVWYDLGLLQSTLGQRPQALDSLNKAIQLDPEFAQAHNTLGAVLAETGLGAQAEQSFRTALALEPAMAEAHSNLANLLSTRDALPEAEWHFQHSSTNALDRYNHAVTLARMNRFAAAQTQIESALRADPNFPEAHDLLGGLLEAKGQTAAAIEEYRAALRLRPGFAKAQSDLDAALGSRTR
jgi:tetratricopeptide (TPR) repeat protein